MAITMIDFFLDKHMVRVSNDCVQIYANNDPKKCLEFNADDLKRILRVAEEQLDGEL